MELTGNLEINEMADLGERFIAGLKGLGGYVDLDQSMRLGKPEVRVIPDREKAAAVGVDARTIAQVVQAGIGGIDIASFKEGGHRYDVRVRLEEAFRGDPDAIGALYVRNKDGGVIELLNIARVESGDAPSTISRDQRMR